MKRKSFLSIHSTTLSHQDVATVRMYVKMFGITIRLPCQLTYVRERNRLDPANRLKELHGCVSESKSYFLEWIYYCAVSTFNTAPNHSITVKIGSHYTLNQYVVSEK